MKKSLTKHAWTLAAIFFLIFMVFISACKKEDGRDPSSSNNTTQGASQVSITNMAFNPATITVAVNATVNWTNNDNVAHTVTSDTSGLFNSGSIGSGGYYSSDGSYSRQFTTVGTFPYHCSIHPTMKGTVIVH